MTQITTIAIDLAKHVFQVAAENAQGEEQWQQRLRSREAFQAFLRELTPPLEVLLEAGLGAQAWARGLQARGFAVRVLPAQRVAEHRSGAKNDRNDVRAILRAGRDHAIHAVPVKSVAQLTMQALHRVRAGYVRRRTGVANQMRGLLLEHGIVIAQGECALQGGLTRLTREQGPVPERLRTLLETLFDEWEVLGARVAALDKECAVLVRTDPVAKRLATIPGIGPLTATALACKGLDPAQFANARVFAAHFGLVPDQHSSGSKQRLGRMSRRGDGYIRSLAVNGAHAVLRMLRTEAPDAASRRLLRWKVRHGSKGAAVRLANRNLRIAWALLQRDTDYRRTEAAMAE